MLFSLDAASQNIYTLKEGDISFFSETPVENIEAHNQNVYAFLNTTSREMAFRVPVRKFKFQKALMEEHFNEKYMESDKYPMSTFRGKINEEVDLSKNGEYKVTATGKLSMHGVEREVTAPGTLAVKNGEITLQSDFPVLVKDYDIDIPQLVFQNIAESIAVKVRIKFTPYTQ